MIFSNKLDENDEEKFEPVRSDPLSSHQTELTVGGLSPSTLYQFQVCAYTRKGDGEKSKPRKVKTKAAGLWNFIKNKLSIYWRVKILF